MQNFQTTTGLFVAILIAYVGLTLLLGAKRVYFEPFMEKTDDNTQTKDNEHLK